MRRLLAIVCFGVLIGTARVPAAQQAGTAADLVGSWILVAVDKHAASDEPTRVRGGRGLLVIDSVGNVFEFFSTMSRDEPDAPLVDPQRTLANVGGFWGRYSVDAPAGRIMFEAEAGVSPSVSGLEFTRTYELDGDWLFVTSGDEPLAQGDTRWTWQRLPTVANLNPAYREVVGFWHHIEERRVNETTGEVDRVRRRDPSVIVYTPSGMVGVHFPPLDRAQFAGDTPTDAEALAALRGYIGYFGALGVYPGEVSHNVLAGTSPGTGAILRRYADITGDDLIVRLQSTFPRPPTEGPRFRTDVELHRLSGAQEMLPR